MWWGTSSKTRRVKGGRTERAYCPECDTEGKFVEVEIDEAIKLFSVIDLFEDKTRAFCCVECHAVGQLTDGEPAAALDNLSPEAAERLERARAAERAARLEAERERAERLRIEREVKADQELAELKARMGMAEPPPPEASQAPEASEPAKRPWWKIWGR